MTISTLKPQKNYSSVIYVFLFILAGVLFFVFGRGLMDKLINMGGKSALSVQTTLPGAKVFVDDAFLGETPFNSTQIKPGEHKVSVRSDTNNYETNINFTAGTETMLKRDLGVSPVFSSGSNVWFETKNGDAVLRVISDPSNATIFIDQTNVGKTPYTNSNLTAGDYEISVEFPGYKTFTQRVKVFEEKTLNLSVSLFPIPVPSKVASIKDTPNMYDLSLQNQIITTDTAQWVKAVIYWNTNHGIDVSGVGVNKEPVFDFFIDYKGNFYDKTGTLLQEKAIKELKDAKKGGYLGRLTDAPGLTFDAKDTLALLSGGSQGATATILETGLGWLRVRSEASVESAEVSKVNVGESFEVLEQQPNWVKIKVSDTVEGWVNATYVKIQESSQEKTSKGTEEPTVAGAKTSTQEASTQEDLTQEPSDETAKPTATTPTETSDTTKEVAETEKAADSKQTPTTENTNKGTTETE